MLTLDEKTVMKSKQIAILLGITIVAIFSTSVESAEFYAGFRSLRTIQGNTHYGVGRHLGAVIGISQEMSWRGAFSLELDYSTPLELNSESVGHNMDALGLFAAYRTTHKLYVKAKIGYLNRFPHYGSRKYDGYMTFGFGAGIKLIKFLKLEVDYTLMHQDVFWLGGTILFWI
jgi:hypothetical protein